jgi:nucleotide-binding universal stress UspA family protein
MKYLIGLDGSDLALDGLRHVLALARQGLDCSVVLANVQPGANLYEVVVAHDPEVLAELKLQAGQHALDAGAALCAEAGLPSEQVLAEGEAAPMLIDLAEDNGCDAIVLGARGLGEAGLSSFGRVAEGVLHRAHVPVTLVRRPPPEVEPSDLPPDEEA